MNRIEFGPLVTQQRMSPKETKYFLNRFQSQEKENINTELPDLFARGNMDPNDSNYNKILYRYIKRYIDIFGWKGGFKIKRLWGNIYRQGDFIPPHVHLSGDISFSLVLKMPPIEMLDQKKNEGCLILRYGEDPGGQAKIRPITNQFVLPKAGDLIIFPQNLLHYTIPMSNPKAERISISGNILLTEN